MSSLGMIFPWNGHCAKGPCGSEVGGAARTIPTIALREGQPTPSRVTHRTRGTCVPPLLGHRRTLGTPHPEEQAQDVWAVEHAHVPCTQQMPGWTRVSGTVHSSVIPAATYPSREGPCTTGRAQCPPAHPAPAQVATAPSAGPDVCRVGRQASGHGSGVSRAQTPLQR